MRSTPKNMSPEEIRIAMIRAKVTQVEIARELNITKTTVFLVIENMAVSDRIRRKIAEKCGLDVARIWPDPYLTSGPRKKGRPKAA